MKTTTLPAKSKPLFVIGRPQGTAHAAWSKQIPSGAKQCRTRIASRIFLPPHEGQT